MTNGEIIQVINGLMELEQLKLPLNIKLSYNIAKNRQILKDYAKLIEQKQTEIYSQYGNKEDNFTYKIPNENVEIVQKQLQELFNIENDIAITKVKLDDFGENKITFDIVEKLMPIIEDK